MRLAATHGLARALVLASVWSTVAAVTVPASAQDAGTPPSEALADPPTLEVHPDPRTARIRELVAGSLEVDVEPEALFDVALDDETALAIEAARVRAVLRAADEAARPPEPPPSRPGRRRALDPPDAGALIAALTALDPARWAQRLELDRARLEFYDLPPERRDPARARGAPRGGGEGGRRAGDGGGAAGP